MFTLRPLFNFASQEQRVEFFLKAGKYNEALETAAALKSEEAFDTIVEFGEKRVSDERALGIECS